MNSKRIGQKEALHKTASQGKVWSGHRGVWTGPVTYNHSPQRKIGRWFLLLAAALAFYVWRLGC